MNRTSKGFTLIELLVVIAIVAVLSVVVILTLNPAELLRQARDSNRVSDLATLKSAISLYLADVTTPIVGSSTKCYVSTYTGQVGAQTTACQSMTLGTMASSAVGNYRKVDGTGWIPVNFNSISSGAPVGNLPIDPTNSGAYYYAYRAIETSTVFEINAHMESSRYAASGSSDVESTDGGTSSTVYEVGTASGLAL
jgi:prepilin-type N-terminal cleavage/methylation domain-containing protein